MLEKNLKNLINHLTNDIRELYNIQTPITDIEAAVKAIGGSIKYTDDTWDIGVMRTDPAETKDTFLILIPKTIETNKTFRIAQALGELFLDMLYLIDNEEYNKTPVYIKNTTSFSYEYINYFACAFLMPKYKYLDQIRQHTEGTTVNTKQVAEYFHVDITTASLYGTYLGVLRSF